MKKLICLLLAFLMISTSALLLSACAPDEPETLYGKPKLSQMSDEELLNVINDFLDDENAYFPGNRNADIDISHIRECLSSMEKYHTEYAFFSNHGALYPYLFCYYYDYDYGADGCNSEGNVE